MESAAAELERRWQAWLLARNRRGMQTALLIGVSLYPAFGVVDWLTAPAEALPWLWGPRLVFFGLTLALMPVAASRVFDRHADLVAGIYLWLAGLGISVMTTRVGGLAAPYYAGLTLVVLAGGLLFVWRPAVVVAAQGATVLTFVAANLAAGTAGTPRVAISNLAFLTSTALIASIGQVLQWRTQREQHAQRVRLEQATASLERAHAELQQLDQFKSRFFANMTHELRTPLALVVTPLELLMQGEMGTFTEAQKSSFLTMFRSSLKLLKLINDLLDLSRLEESRLRLEVAEHDLSAHLAALVEETQVLARRKAIRLGYRTEIEGPVPIWCDLERLERVFVNLLSNAIKFTPPGGHVEVGLRARPDEVEVRVEDDGPGFPPEKAARLFERFYQVDMGGNRQHGGAGIGLALAKELVLLHGGAIEAASDGAHGARLSVRLRKGRLHLRPEALATGTRAAGEADPDGAQDWAVQLAARREFRLLDIEEAAERRVVERDVDEERRPYTVVVVEDSPQITQFIHMTLRRQFKVLTAPDGLKGLEMVRRELPHLVVTDLMMPGLDGLGMTRQLRDDPLTRHVPVIMLTARGDLDDRVRGLETGVTTYLTKPFSPRELLTCARQLVQAKEEAADLVLTQRMDSLEIVAAGVAHELNNPLNYVKASLSRVRRDAEQLLQLAGEGPADAGARQRLERIGERLRELLGVADAGLKRIGGTVELLGRYGRAGYRREHSPHDAFEAARTVVEVVLPATGRAVKVELDLEGDGTVECVPEELGQVLTNLVQNAIEAVPDGGRVRLRGRGDADALTISVKDDGPGIEPEAMSRLFTPFFTTKGPGRGTGLGLTISRRVVEALHGTLKVASTPGQGAEFTIRLPRRQPAAGGATAAG